MAGHMEDPGFLPPQIQLRAGEVPQEILHLQRIRRRNTGRHEILRDGDPLLAGLIRNPLPLRTSRADQKLLLIRRMQPAAREPPGAQNVIMMTVGQNQPHRPIGQRPHKAGDILQAVSRVDQDRFAFSLDQRHADAHDILDMGHSGRDFLNGKHLVRPPS